MVTTPQLAAVVNPTKDSRAWVVLIVLLLFSVAAPLNMGKVSPILPVLMDAFNLTVSRAGLLMSVNAITGLILALPAGVIFQKLGYRVTGLIAGGSIVIGAVIGALSTDVNTLLASRVIEGIGTSFMAVLAPAVITLWFSAKQRGLVLGIWAVWVPVGSTSMAILAPILSQNGNWQLVWWFGAAFALVVTVLFLFTMRISPQGNGSAAPAIAPLTIANLSSVIRNRNVWLIGAAFGLFIMTVGGFTSYMPTFLNLIHDTPLQLAALIASIGSLISIVSCPIGGMISDKIGSRKRPYLFGMIVQALALPLYAVLPVGGIIVLAAVLGMVTGLIPTNIFAAGVEATGDERLGGLAMGIIMVGQNAGSLIGPVLFGSMVESFGWTVAILCGAALGGLAIAAGALARVK